MCCSRSSVCQHHQSPPNSKVGRLPQPQPHLAPSTQPRQLHSPGAAAAAKLCLLVGVVLLNLSCVTIADAQIAYHRYLSELRIQELHNIAIRLNHSIDADKYVCDSYFDYVCGRNRPLFSILGHLPTNNELLNLMTELQQDPEENEAKTKLLDFFISCNTVKSLEDCYLESFEYFKPIFGYIISKKYLDQSSHELKDFLRILKEFVTKSAQISMFNRNIVRQKLEILRDKFKVPQMYFRLNDMTTLYKPLKIYRQSYTHNIRNLELFRRKNTTFDISEHKTMLDWTLYLYQSRNKPLSYYYPTFNVHLWMTLYNATERGLEPKRYAEISECLKLPQFVNVLDEARILAIVYLKSFNKAWEDYEQWIASSAENQEIYDQENSILNKYQLDNKKIFFTLYGQNFCEFGKDLAENVFYLGLKHSRDFYSTYSCGYQTERNAECF